MKPILFESTETQFESHGIGTLAETISCLVTEERNGPFTLALEYPDTGRLHNELTAGRLILAQSRPGGRAQPFRIKAVTRGMSGNIKVEANHISYDLSGIVANPFGSVEGAEQALEALFGAASTPNPFTAESTDTTPGSFNLNVPASIRSRLGGVEGSILDVFGGEFEWDGFAVKHHGSRGQDRGVRIEYGVNLTDLEQDTNLEATFTGVYPYWCSTDGSTVVRLTSAGIAPDAPLVKVQGSFDRQKIASLDLSQKFDEKPTEQQLYNAAVSYINSNGIGKPKVSIKVSFLDLAAVQGVGFFQRVDLCDIVHVHFVSLGIDTTAKVIKAEYNVLLDRYESLTLGDAKSTFADTVVGIASSVQSSIQSSEARMSSAVSTAVEDAADEMSDAMRTAIQTATDLITGESGGYVKINTDAAGKPFEILIMDTEDISTAQKIWRWNSGGLGYSKNGYNGTFATAITQNGAIVASFITTGTLNADVINVASIFAENISATGQITFNNGLYSLKGESDGSVRIGANRAFWVWGNPVVLNSLGNISASCQGTLLLQCDQTLTIEGDTGVVITAPVGGVKINGKQLVFQNDGSVTWVQT